MSAGYLDWTKPWYAPWRDWGQGVAARWTAGEPLHQALNGQPGAALRFVAPQAAHGAAAYEAFVHATGCCPVRDGLHDFFNGLCWLAFPNTKHAFNRLHAAEIGRDGVSGRRGPVRDAITLFDENGAVLSAPPLLWQALLARDWRRLFIDLRPLWGQACLTVLGHALLEQLAAPRKNLTAHVLAVPAPAGSWTELDAWLVTQMEAQRLTLKPFTPLPVMGLPGWCPGNAVDSFYDDSQVFRPRRAET